MCYYFIMENTIGKWNQLDKTVSLTSRLADLVLRTRRLLLAQQINQLHAMVDIHATTLAKDPRGRACLAKIKTEFANAKKQLQKGQQGV